MSNFRKYLDAEAISGVFQIKWEVVYGMGGQQSMFFLLLAFILCTVKLFSLVGSK